MPFSSIGKFLPKIANPKLVGHVRTALALEAGTAFLRKRNAALAARVALVSVKGGVVHARALSAAAKADLESLKSELFEAMKNGADMPLSRLYAEVRSRLAEDGQF